MRTDVYTKNDTVSMEGQNLEGKILVVPMGHFKPSYQEPQFQLVRATGGFGCSPVTVGTAVFVTFLADGEKTRYERYEFEGILKEELVAELSKEELPFL